MLDRLLWRRPNASCVTIVVLIAILSVATPQAQNSGIQPGITAPKEQFGHDIGDDYFLVNYTQYLDYLRKLAQGSVRTVVMEIGKTEEGRPELTAIITSPENHGKLAHLKRSTAGLRSPMSLRRTRRAGSRRKGRRSSGSTAACTLPRCSARSS